MSTIKLKTTPQKKTVYKNSGIEWIGKIPEDWDLRKIKEVTHLKIGWTPDTSVSSYFEGGNLWATIADMDSKIINETKSRISDKAIEDTGIKKVKKGSWLYSFKLSVGKVAFAGQDLYTNEAIAAFESSDKLDTTFAYYAFSDYLLNYANENIYGAKLLNQYLIKNAVIALPTLPEQKKVVDFLDSKISTIDHVIEQKRKLKALLKEKRTAIINRAVTRGLDENVELVDSGVEWIGKVPKGWRVERLKFLMNFQNGFAFSSEDYIDEGIPLIRIGEVKENIDFENTKKLPVDYAQSHSSFLVRYGDLLIAMTGYVGETAMYMYEQKALLNQRVGIMKPKSGLNTKFLYYWTQTPSFKTFLSLQSKSSAQENVGEAEIGKFQISLPKLDEQVKIVAVLDKSICDINDVIHKIEKTIGLLEEYRTSLISHVVTGKVEI